MLSQVEWLEKSWLSAGVVGVLLLGNFLIYPKHIAQGWDCTLVHAPFYQLEKQMHAYIVESGIEIKDVGTAFPLKNHRKFITLEDTDFRYKEYDFNSDQYILYSTVMNSFSDFELDALFTHWKQKKRFKTARIEIILFERE